MSREKEKGREKRKGKKLHEPRKLIYQSLSLSFTEEDKQLHPTTHITAQTLIMNGQEAALLSLCKGMRSWGCLFGSLRGQRRPSIASFPLAGLVAPSMRKHLATWD